MGTYVSDSRLFRDQFSTPRMREIFSEPVIGPGLSVMRDDAVGAG